MKTRTMLVSVLLVAAVLLTACPGTTTTVAPTHPPAPTAKPAEPTKPPEPTAEPTAEPPMEEVTITLWNQWNDEYAENIKVVFDEYTAMHPNVKIDLSKPEDVQNALSVAVPAG